MLDAPDWLLWKELNDNGWQGFLLLLLLLLILLVVLLVFLDSFIHFFRHKNETSLILKNSIKMKHYFFVHKLGGCQSLLSLSLKALTFLHIIYYDAGNWKHFCCSVIFWGTENFDLFFCFPLDFPLGLVWKIIKRCLLKCRKIDKVLLLICIRLRVLFGEIVFKL